MSTEVRGTRLHEARCKTWAKFGRTRRELARRGQIDCGDGWERPFESGTVVGFGAQSTPSGGSGVGLGAVRRGGPNCADPPPFRARNREDLGPPKHTRNRPLRRANARCSAISAPSLAKSSWFRDKSGRCQAKLGRLRQNVDHLWSNSGQTWPFRADCGRNWSMLFQKWPSSVQSWLIPGCVWSMQSQTSPSLVKTSPFEVVELGREMSRDQTVGRAPGREMSPTVLATGRISSAFGPSSAKCGPTGVSPRFGRASGSPHSETLHPNTTAHVS